MIDRILHAARATFAIAIALAAVACGGSDPGTTTDAGERADGGTDASHGNLGGCTIGGTHVGAGDANADNPCELCDPQTSTTSWTTLPDGASCSPGVCNQGLCVCPLGTFSCNNQCDLFTTTDNCGRCGNACSDGQSCDNGTCRVLPAVMPTARSSLSVTAGTDGRIYALGGWNGGGDFGHTYATLEIFDPTANSWTTGAPMPTSRNEQATAAAAGHLYAIGGTTGNLEPPLATLEIYDVATNSWTTGAPMPTARMSLCAALGSDGRIYAIGGGNEGYPDGTYVFSGAVEAYTPSTNKWATMAPLPTPREDMACTVGHDGKIYVMGGVGAGGESAVVEVYDVATNHWSTVAPMPGTRELFAALTSPSGKLYAISGVADFEYSADVYTFEPTTNAWALDSALTSARAQFGAALGGDAKLYAIGGYDGAEVLSTVVTDSATDGWVP